MAPRLTVLRPTADPDAFPRPTVVTVDDEQLMQNMYKLVLGKAGWRVVPVVDPREAVARCLEVKPQLVIVDLNMPFLNGEQVVQELRSVMGRRVPPILIVSGVADFEAIETRLGLCFGLPKPFSQPDLLASCTAAVVQYAHRLAQAGPASNEAQVGEALRQAQALLEAQARQLEELRGALRVDGLTQLANRTGFDEKLREVLSLRQRHAEARVSLLMMDVDHFKGINDTHGHPAGDSVLKHVAAAVKASLRTTDYVARLGGDEFGMILAQTPISSAEQVGRRLCVELRGLQVPWEQGRLGVTVSMGVTEADGSDTAETVVKRADDALYRVKESGRDNVQVADVCEPSPQFGRRGASTA